MLVLAFLLFAGRGAMGQGKYDPLSVPKNFTAATLERTIRDAARDRDIPIKVYLPAGTSPAPVLLFSHGLGGSREGNAFLGKHWAGRGYVAVFVQHPGSDTSVWKDAPPAKRMDAMNQAANGENFKLRVQDVHAVIDQLERWNNDRASPLAGRFDTGHIGMSGHSFGAVTTQAVSGQWFGRLVGNMTDTRIKAAVMFSPSSPTVETSQWAFGRVSIPWMLMTGTKDTSIIGRADVASRLAVFPALPPGNKYEVVLDNAEHSAFADRALPGDKEQRNPNHHRVILALTTAFWDAYLRGDKAAREWLDGDGPRFVLEPKDRWQKK